MGAIDWHNEANRIAMERDQALRERDEERCTAAFWRHQHDTQEELLFNKAQRFERERDEARTEIDRALSLAETNLQSCRKAERERDEERALLAEGLALWDSEPKPGLRSAWFDFWAKVRATTKTGTIRAPEGSSEPPS